MHAFRKRFYTPESEIENKIKKIKNKHAHTNGCIIVGHRKKINMKREIVAIITQLDTKLDIDTF